VEEFFRAAWERFAGRRTLADNRALWPEPAVGRGAFLALLVPVAREQEVVARVSEVQRALGALPEVDSIPPHWLHLTVQSVGFVDDPGLDPEQVDCIPAEAEARLRAIRPFSVELRNANSFPEAAFVEAYDGGRIREIRAALREALPLLTSRPSDGLYRRGVDLFAPHLSIGYYNRTGAADGVIRALGPFRSFEVGAAEIHSIDLALVDMSEPHRFAEFERAATIPLGG
jgi:2'-5' RNA ligase